MIPMSRTLVESLIEYYMYANTPSYIYRRYRELEEISSIGRNQNVQAISSDIWELLEKLESLEDMARAYGLIVALSFKSYSEVQDVLDSLAKCQVDWIGQLSGYIHAKMESATMVIMSGYQTGRSHPAQHLVGESWHCITTATVKPTAKIVRVGND